MPKYTRDTFEVQAQLPFRNETILVITTLPSSKLSLTSNEQITRDSFR